MILINDVVKKNYSTKEKRRKKTRFIKETSIEREFVIVSQLFEH